jgi:hypothetical protein
MDFQCRVKTINGLLRGIAFSSESSRIMAAAGSSLTGTANKKAGTRPAFRS